MQEKKQPSAGNPAAKLTPEQQAARRRSSLNYGFSFLTMLGLGLVFALLVLFLIVFPRSSKSNIEKRDLAKFPAFTFQDYFSGKFTEGIATFYDDTVPFRDDFKNMGNNFKGLFGIQSKETVAIIGNPIKPVKPSGNTTTSSTSSGTASSTTSEEAQSSEPQTDFTKEKAEGNLENGMLIINQNGHWRGLELFGGSSGDAYVSALNTLRGKLGEDVKIYSMPAPLASEFYTPSNFAEYNSSQKECFESLAKRMKPGITSVDCTNVLAQHSEEEIYCRTDHHWQPLGAYYAAQAFAKAADVPFANLNSYKKVGVEGFVGTLYAFSGDSRILNDPETFTYYEPPVKTSTDYYDTSFNYTYTGDLLVTVDTANAYLRFLGGDEQVAKVKTTVKNDRKLLVIKDSYGNAEIPFYTSSFEEIYVVDMRYFQRNLVQFIKSMDITDVLFSCASYSAVGENAKNINTLITQDAGSTIKDTAPKSNVSDNSSSTASSASEAN